MARTPLTPAQRAAAIKAAAADIVALIERAESIELSDDDVCGCPEGNAEGITEVECGCRARRAWEIVEQNGATIHRQARLLAGKSRGG